MAQSRMLWPARNTRTEHDDKLSLEKRINHLTATVKNMQKIMDRFIALYESEKLLTLAQGQRSQGVDATRSNEGNDRNKAQNQKYLVTLLKQVEIHDENKQKWLLERSKLQTELNYYKFLLQKEFSTQNSSTQTVPIEVKNVQSGWSRYTNCKTLSFSSKNPKQGQSLKKLPTSNSSSQTCSSDFIANELKSQTGCIRTYKCHECGKSYRHKVTLRLHQDKCVPNNPDYSCVFCNQEFFQIDDFRLHLQTSHGSSGTTKPTNSSMVFKPVENTKDRNNAVCEDSIGLRCEPTVAEEKNKQKQEQKVQQALEVDRVWQDLYQIAQKRNEEPKINLSHSISKLLTPASLIRLDEELPTNASSLSLTVPSMDLIDDEARKKFRKNLISLMDQHQCDNVDCLSVNFRNSINHAKECTLGSNCEFYICQQKHFRSEHLKVCDFKCTQCRMYRRFFVNEKYMMSLIEIDCTAKIRRTSRGVSLTMATITCYVNYGLADINEENVDTETQVSSSQEVKIEEKTSSSALEDDEAVQKELPCEQEEKVEEQKNLSVLENDEATEKQLLSDQEDPIDSQSNLSTSAEDDEAAGWELLEYELENIEEKFVVINVSSE